MEGDPVPLRLKCFLYILLTTISNETLKVSTVFYPPPDRIILFLTQGVLKVRKRVTLMVLSVTSLFEITWISDNVIHVLKDFGLCAISDVSFPITHTMIVFNSAVNPFAYALINQRFREKMKGMLCNSSSASEGNIKADHVQIIRLRHH